LDIFFADPSEVPLPPGEVRIQRLEASLLPDGRRVHVYLELTPFQKKPNGEISLANSAGAVLADISFIETMSRKMEYTLHLRGAELTSPYTISAKIYYENTEPVAQEDEQPPGQAPKIYVDQAETIVVIP
jgi:hypothetical protein